MHIDSTSTFPRVEGPHARMSLFHINVRRIDGPPIVSAVYGLFMEMFKSVSSNMIRQAKLPYYEMLKEHERPYDSVKDPVTEAIRNALRTDA